MEDRREDVHRGAEVPLSELPRGESVHDETRGSFGWLASPAAFWMAQLVGWSTYAAILFLTYLPSLEPGRAGSLLLNKFLRVPVAIAASAVLRWIYDGLRRRGASAPVLITSAVVACFVLGWCVLEGHRLLVIAVGLLPSGTPLIEPVTMPRGTVEFAFALLAWSTAYAGVVLFQRSEKREREAVEARRLAQEAQLQMLAYQLNPHFLFNALHSIRSMIDEDRGKARQMVTELAGFLRYALLARPMHSTPLRDELDALRDYLAIEKIRFEERLDVQLDIDARATTCAVPAFLLRPLVENAIKHGSGGRAGGPLCVRLAARVLNDRLTIDVSNTGSLARSETTRAERRTGVGLANVRSRLEHLYPGAHRVTVEEDGEWVRVRIELPATGAGREVLTA